MLLNIALAAVPRAGNSLEFLLFTQSVHHDLGAQRRSSQLALPRRGYCEKRSSVPRSSGVTASPHRRDSLQARLVPNTGLGWATGEVFFFFFCCLRGWRWRRAGEPRAAEGWGGRAAGAACPLAGRPRGTGTAAGTRAAGCCPLGDGVTATDGTSTAWWNTLQVLFVRGDSTGQLCDQMEQRCHSVRFCY